MGITTKALLKSLWVFHLSTGSCNNCDIEVLVGSIRHADVLLVTGSCNRKSAERLVTLYKEAPQPCLVVAIGECSLSRGIFIPSYNCPKPLDELVPVSAYIPGCPPKPEAIISGIVKLIQKVKGK
jgi:Ni,Fe-hydrogenase III small subunit